ncbi:MAG: hypothetical protein H0X39_06230 [Actinobacteria bacterium]|nr:hypothetical protein [Actinomycetota bacterium]
MLSPTEQIDIHSTWYPWCKVCAAAGWTVDSVVLSDSGLHLCADCAEDELVGLGVAA